MLKKCKISPNSFVDGQFVKGRPDFRSAVSAKGAKWASGTINWAKKDGEGFIYGNKKFICFDEATINFMEANISSPLTIQCSDIDLKSWVSKKDGEVKVDEVFVISSAKLAPSKEGDTYAASKDSNPIPEGRKIITEEDDDSDSIPF